MSDVLAFTNDPRRRAFLDVPADHPLPLQNLPFCVFQRVGEEPRCGVGIGDGVLDLAERTHGRDSAEYAEALSRLDSVTQARLGDGDWNAQPSGGLIKAESFGPDKYFPDLPPRAVG